MVEVSCYNGANGELTQVDVDTAPFGEKVRMRLVRQACLHYAAAHRLGCHSTKTRGEVNRTERRPWRQKGTGRARAGDFSSPLWRGGGVVAGPKPRNYSSNMPRRMRKEALRSSLLGKIRDGEVKLLDGLTFDQPKTKTAKGALEALGITGDRTTVVIADRGDNLHKSFRNLKNVKVTLANDLNAEHVVRCQRLVLDRKALDQLIARVGND